VDTVQLSHPDCLARAEALRPLIRGLADRIERERRLPVELLDSLHEARLFRLLLPRAQNGLEIDPLTWFHIIETVAREDASTAWCLGQGGGCAMSAAYLDPAVARRIFGEDPRTVLAWGPGPKVRAVAVEGGYRMTGTWSFASGCRHATWLGAHAPIVQADGTPVLEANGRQAERTMLVPASEVAWTDIWDTIGLRGTASDAFSLNDHFVPHAHSIIRDFTRECREAGPLYRISASAMYQIAFAGVALGIARSALDLFVSEARAKVPRGDRHPIRDSQAVQSGLGRAEAGVRAGRALLLQTVATIWAEVTAPTGRFTIERRIDLRMASTHAIHAAREGVDFAYNAMGASAIFGSHPLERRFRDVHTVTQQLQGRAAHFETAGLWLMGGAPDMTFA